MDVSTSSSINCPIDSIEEEMYNAACDKSQAFVAYILYKQLKTDIKIEKLNWHYESVLKMIILETRMKSNMENVQIIVPTSVTFLPSPSWIRSCILQIESKFPLANILLAVSSRCDFEFVLYTVHNGLKLPKNHNLESLRRTNKEEIDED